MSESQTESALTGGTELPQTAAVKRARPGPTARPPAGQGSTPPGPNRTPAHPPPPSRSPAPQPGPWPATGSGREARSWCDDGAARQRSRHGGRLRHSQKLPRKRGAPGSGGAGGGARLELEPDLGATRIQPQLQPQLRYLPPARPGAAAATLSAAASRPGRGPPPASRLRRGGGGLRGVGERAWVASVSSSCAFASFSAALRRLSASAASSIALRARGGVALAQVPRQPCWRLRRQHPGVSSAQARGRLGGALRVGGEAVDELNERPLLRLRLLHSPLVRLSRLRRHRLGLRDAHALRHLCGKVARARLGLQGARPRSPKLNGNRLMRRIKRVSAAN